jgi:hypothetical protein
MADRPTPPDPFARQPSQQTHADKQSLSEALSSFKPTPIAEVSPPMVPLSNIAPDTGRGGRPRRRGDPETRTKAINFRMKPREQAELNALCRSGEAGFRPKHRNRCLPRTEPLRFSLFSAKPQHEPLQSQLPMALPQSRRALNMPGLRCAR